MLLSRPRSRGLLQMVNATTRILEAAAFAAAKHDGQYRKGKGSEPYIVHPLRVAKLLIEVGGVTDTDTIVAAILHDTIEDTETRSDEIVAIFGNDVATIVSEVTDDKSLPKAVRKQKQVEHAPGLSHAAKQLKMCDKISNITDVLADPASDWTQERKREYVAWGKRVFEGLRGVNPDLEAHFDRLVEQARREL